MTVLFLKMLGRNLRRVTLALPVGLLPILFLSAAPAADAPRQRPNFLIVIADDATFDELPLYGGKNLRNLTPDALYFEKHVMGTVEHGPYWLSWVWKAAGDPQALKLVERYMRRPAEELYDVQSDPLELKNLAAEPAHAACKARLAAELDRWLCAQRDPGAALDTPQFRTK